MTSDNESEGEGAMHDPENLLSTEAQAEGEGEGESEDAGSPPDDEDVQMHGPENLLHNMAQGECEGKDAGDPPDDEDVQMHGPENLPRTVAEGEVEGAGSRPEGENGQMLKDGLRPVKKEGLRSLSGSEDGSDGDEALLLLEEKDYESLPQLLSITSLELGHDDGFYAGLDPGAAVPNPSCASLTQLPVSR